MVQQATSISTGLSLEKLVDLGEEFVLVCALESGNGSASFEELESRHSLDLLLSGDVLELVDVNLCENDFAVESLRLLRKPGSDHSARSAPSREIVDDDQLAL